MFSSDTVLIEMVDDRFIAGQGRARGSRCRVPPADAHEAVAFGWACFADPSDADRARAAFAEQQQREVAKLPQRRVPDEWRGSPWRPL